LTYPTPDAFEAWCAAGEAWCVVNGIEPALFCLHIADEPFDPEAI
jgi:hypothetical protein